VLAGYYRDDLVWEGNRLVFAARRIDIRATSPVKPAAT
jgi:hypothetical protein